MSSMKEQVTFWFAVEPILHQLVASGTGALGPEGSQQLAEVHAVSVVYVTPLCNNWGWVNSQISLKNILRNAHTILFALLNQSTGMFANVYVRECRRTAAQFYFADSIRSLCETWDFTGGLWNFCTFDMYLFYSIDRLHWVINSLLYSKWLEKGSGYYCWL